MQDTGGESNPMPGDSEEEAKDNNGAEEHLRSTKELTEKSARSPVADQMHRLGVDHLVIK